MLDAYNNLEELRQNYRFTYIDVGARWGAKSKLLKFFPNSRWVGFEPDPNEFNIISSNKKRGQECLPFALNDKLGTQDLYITSSPDWSSLYEPDSNIFKQFNGLNNFYHVIQQRRVPLKSLDELIISYKDLLGSADYLKLDIQGAEADVLRGAKTLLSTSLMAVEVEAEFLQLYKGQTLFDQIHRIMLDNGFMLFDLSRNRCIRSGFTTDIETRGQVLWSDVLYLKDSHNLILEKNRDKLLVLILVAMELGFPDYALSIVNTMAANKIINDGLQQEIRQAVAAIGVRQRKKTWIVDMMAKLPYGRRFLKYLRKLIDDNYSRIVSLAHPEYYFRRD